MTEKKDGESTPVWHRMRSPGVSACGVYGPNENLTDVPANVTCPSCKHFGCPVACSLECDAFNRLTPLLRSETAIDLDLDALERAHKATTPTQWAKVCHTQKSGPDFWTINRATDGYVGAGQIARVMSATHGADDAGFIHLAHEKWPALIAEVRRLRAERGRPTATAAPTEAPTFEQRFALARSPFLDAVLAFARLHNGESGLGEYGVAWETLVREARALPGAGRENPTGGGKTAAMLRSAYESVLRDGIDVRIVRAGKNYDAVMAREDHPQPVMSGERRIEAGGEIPDVIGEIVTWLHGLEEARENTVSVSTDAHEIAIMRARRGVYEGIADDIKRKWGSR